MNLENIKIDEVILNRLKIMIFHIERENLKTKKLKQYEMNEKIRKIIEREVLD